MALTWSNSVPSRENNSFNSSVAFVKVFLEKEKLFEYQSLFFFLFLISGPNLFQYYFFFFYLMQKLKLLFFFSSSSSL